MSNIFAFSLSSSLFLSPQTNDQFTNMKQRQCASSSSFNTFQATALSYEIGRPMLDKHMPPCRQAKPCTSRDRVKDNVVLKRRDDWCNYGCRVSANKVRESFVQFYKTFTKLGSSEVICWQGTRKSCKFFTRFSRTLVAVKILLPVAWSVGARRRGSSCRCRWRFSRAWCPEARPGWSRACRALLGWRMWRLAMPAYADVVDEHEHEHEHDKTYILVGILVTFSEQHRTASEWCQSVFRTESFPSAVGFSSSTPKKNLRKTEILRSRILKKTRVIEVQYSLG